MQAHDTIEEEEALDTIMSSSARQMKQSTRKVSDPFPGSQHASSSAPITPIPGLQVGTPSNYSLSQPRQSFTYNTNTMEAIHMAEEDVAGPSRLSLPLRQGLTSSIATPGQSSRMRRKPARITLTISPRRKGITSKSNFLQVDEAANQGSRSMPSSPVLHNASQKNVEERTEVDREQLRATLRGSVRRRPSVPFGLRVAKLPSLSIPEKPARRLSQDPPSSKTLPPVWQDPSEHILSGDGSSLQHARSVYASGPVEVLPGLFLGDEFNARDDLCLARLGITTILNVAKETTLPFQSEAASEPIDFLFGSGSLSKGMQQSLHLGETGETAATPTSSTHPGLRSGRKANYNPPKSAYGETFFTPLTSIQPSLSPSVSTAAVSSRRPSSSFYLHNTTSTPNLYSNYSIPRSSKEDSSSAPSTTDEEEEDDEEEEGGSRATGSVSSQPSMISPGSTPPSPIAPLPSDLSIAKGTARSVWSPAELSVQTPSSNGGHSIRSIATTHSTGASSSSSSSNTGSFYSIALPHNAIALNIPPSPQTGRQQSLRYIKLPWTHDETDLAGGEAGGFVTGCSIIADTLGIDLKSGQFSGMPFSQDGSKRTGGGVLVHCQCGVSRSATLVIAFVMQAAAYNYQYQSTQRLTGMHDCYEMVKELSSSISPNCSLIYQLVEWERYLSKQVATEAPPTSAINLDAGTACIDDVAAAAAGDTPAKEGSGKKVWGNEAMNEEDWTRMRMDEERKEREEEEGRLREAGGGEVGKQESGRMQLMTPPKISFSVGDGGAGANTTGLGARRRRPTPTLTLTSSAKQAADQAMKEDECKTVAPQGSKQGVQLASQEGVVPTRLSLSSTRSPFLLNPIVSPALASGTSSNGSGTSVAGDSPHPLGTFGLNRQNAAERRNKHKRTFSSELPFRRPSLVSLTAAAEALAESGSLEEGDEDTVMA
ncbi:hypothetical protein CBS101457_005488 [Exobasidium rhododendri]|nr:hypothetical protein CBS101457_005488 [Exobasidium rhododendri]